MVNVAVNTAEASSDKQICPFSYSTTAPCAPSSHPKPLAIYFIIYVTETNSRWKPDRRDGLRKIRHRDRQVNRQMEQKMPGVRMEIT